MKAKKNRLRITYNSPVVLTFAAVCAAALLVNTISGGLANSMLFSVYRTSFSDPLAYVRVFTHVIGHADWEHFSGNMLMILLSGPLLEEKYGGKALILVMLATALITGVIHIALFDNVILLGASGIAFSFILMASAAGAKDGEIPLTLIIAAVIYIGGEIADGISLTDNISNLTHAAGGIVGAVAGMIFMKPSVKKMIK